jgi:pentatricopeptide repeat protein
MVSLPSTVSETVGHFFVDVQTELMFVVIAIATHLLFFGRLTIKRGAGKQKTAESLVKRSDATDRAALASFQAEVGAGELGAAMRRFEALKYFWQQHNSPSWWKESRPVLEKFSQLALEHGQLTELLRLIDSLDLVGKMLDVVVIECAKLPTGTDALDQVTEFARSCNVEHFSSTTYQALITGPGFRGDLDVASQAMSDAQQHGVADLPLYGAYIKLYLKQGCPAQVRSTFLEMRAPGMLTGPAPTVVFFNGLLTYAVGCSIGPWIIAEEMKAFEVKLDHVSCSILLKGVNKSKAHGVKDLERVVKLMDIIEDNIDDTLVSSLVEASVRVGRADLSVPFLRKQRSSRRFVAKTAHVYASIIRAYGMAQDMEGAWGVWNEMREQNIAPISVTLGCMVEAAATNGDIEGGYTLVQEMLRDANTAPLVNAVMFGSIAKGFSHKKQFDRVWQIYDEMLERKLKLSIVTFNTLIDACSRSGDLTRIPSLLKEMNAQGIQMGMATYGAIVKGYCQANRLDEAFALVEDMKCNTEFQPDEIIFNVLLDGCARQGLYERGMNVLQSMDEAGVRPTNYTLSVVVKLANRGRQLEKAFELCEQLSKEHGFRLNVHVFDNLVQACIAYRDVPRAIGVFERMLREKVRPDVRTYSLLLRACIEHHRLTDVAGLVRAATGLPGTLAQLSEFSASAMQPQGGLPGDLVSETLWGIMGQGPNARPQEERIAAELLLDLSRASGLKLDPKLRLRLATRIADVSA